MAKQVLFRGKKSKKCRSVAKNIRYLNIQMPIVWTNRHTCWEIYSGQRLCSTGSVGCLCVWHRRYVSASIYFRAFMCCTGMCVSVPLRCCYGNCITRFFLPRWLRLLSHLLDAKEEISWWLNRGKHLWYYSGLYLNEDKGHGGACNNMQPWEQNFLCYTRWENSDAPEYKKKL